MKRKVQIDWEKGVGLVPAIVQDVDTGVLLMLGYMNRAAFQKTLKTKKVWFWSRNKKRLWMKGEVSGNHLTFVDYSVDCDGDTLLVKARPAGPTCHTGEYSCFGEHRTESALSGLVEVIEDRKKNMPSNSYTTSLFRAGRNAISAKVKEEALEVVKAAKKETRKRLVEESVDLIYHLLVLLSERKITLVDIEAEIEKRRK